jgi:ABC-type transporter Mla MlaB component
MPSNAAARVGTCKVDVQRSADSVLLKLEGQITESSTFAMLFMKPEELSGAKILKIDLSGIDRINSNGVRGWLVFIEKLQAKIKVTFSAISEAIIEQATMTPYILGKEGTPIEAFEMPYTCPKCNTRWIQTIRTPAIDLSKNQFSPPKAACPKCRTQGVFDAMEAEYFALIKRSMHE